MAMDKPRISVSAQAALVRQMLLDDSSLTLEGLETAYPEYAEGVAAVLAERADPAKAASACGPMPELLLADIL
jgi:hypothetical protein